MSNLIKLAVFVPISHADQVRQVMGEVGAGGIGNYSHCTWSTTGFGRFKPLDGAKPAIGEVGKLETVEEERIETICKKELVKAVLAKIKEVHPYEEVAFDIYPLLDENEII